MPEKETSEDVLRDLYVTQGLSTREIGRILNVSFTTICNRLSEFGIKKRPAGYSFLKERALALCPDLLFLNNDNALKNTLSPFSIGKLEELYRAGYSSYEIAAKATLYRIDGKSFGSSTVLLWIRLAGIGIRSCSSACKISHAKSLKVKNHMKKLHSLPPTEKQITARRNSAKKSIKKAIRTSIKAHKMRRFLFVCANPGCGIVISLPPAKFNRSVRHFHSRSCSAKFYAHERKIQRLTGNPAAKLAEIEQEKKRQVKELFGIDMDAPRK